MTKGILLAVLLALFGAPLLYAQSEGLGDAQALIRKLDQNFASALNAEDLDSALSFLAPDCAFLIDRQPALEGLEAIRAYGSHIKGTGARVVIETTRVEQSGNLAFELARYTWTIPQKDGSKVEKRGKLVNVWRRQPDGQWRMAVHAPSGDPVQQR